MTRGYLSTNSICCVQFLFTTQDIVYNLFSFRQ